MIELVITGPEAPTQVEAAARLRAGTLGRTPEAREEPPPSGGRSAFEAAALVAAALAKGGA